MEAQQHQPKHWTQNILNKQRQLFQKTNWSKRKRKKPNFFNCLLQSSGVVKHSPFNSQVALTTHQLSLMILFSTGWDSLSVVHRGWALLDIATGVLVGCLDWSPWAGTVGNDWPSVGWGPWSFSGQAATSRGLQGYCRSIARLWAVEWLSARSCRDVCGFCGDSPIFCLHFIGLHIC